MSHTGFAREARGSEPDGAPVIVADERWSAEARLTIVKAGPWPTHAG